MDPSGDAHPFSAVEGALIKVARSLTSSLDVQQVCAAVLDAVEDIFAAESSWLLLHDAARNVLRTCQFRGPGSSAYAGAEFPIQSALSGSVLASRRPLFVPDAAREPRWYDPERVRTAGLGSVFMLPLVHRDVPIGVLGLDSPRFAPDRPPLPLDVARLEALAAQAAIALANARAFEASERDRRRLRRLLDQRVQMRRQVAHLREELKTAGQFGTIVGESPVFREVLHQAELVAPADTTVLILGETGTGKELLARFIHDHSRRASRPFIAVNCAALPETLVESELFGYEKGAFTGAGGSKPGKFELADGGTLFLDEIGDLPLDAQAKTLRVLQDQLVERVGSTRPRAVDVRIVAATNHDLRARIDEGRFRLDLFYRVGVFPLSLPPLRNRQDDVEPLVRCFLDRFGTRLGKTVTEIAPDALAQLRAYSWPGNVRELQNVVERAVILASGRVLTADAVGPLAAMHAGTDTSAQPAGDHPQERTPVAGQHEPPLRELPAPTPIRFADAERNAILAALEAAHWRISGPQGAARLLALKPTTLHAKMKKLGISRPETPIAIAG